MVLAVDDDREIAQAIRLLLKDDGIDCVCAYGGGEAAEVLRRYGAGIECVILDIMMPKTDGLTALMKIRESRNVPVLLLSAKSENSDKVLGLSMGADDYLTKPFHPAELVARVKSLIRRYTKLGDTNAKENTTVIGDLRYDFERKTLCVNDRDVTLTATETRILELFLRNPERVFSAGEIYERVWGDNAFASDNTVMVHIRRLREKIEVNPREPRHIKTIWGIGYKLVKGV